MPVISSSKKSTDGSSRNPLFRCTIQKVSLGSGIVREKTPPKGGLLIDHSPEERKEREGPGYRGKGSLTCCRWVEVLNSFMEVNHPRES